MKPELTSPMSWARPSSSSQLPSSGLYKSKSLLMSVKEESEKAVLKLNIHKSKITASGPIISLQIDGEKVATVTDFISWAPKSLWMVTAAMKLKDVCSLEEKL